MRRMAIIAAVLVVAGLATSTARADHFSFSGGYGHGGHNHGGYGRGGAYGYGGGRGFRAPIYHAPSIHYDRVYHADTLHWTPGRGLHSHGHYDVVPHYTPGHFDTLHRNHVHVNPWYHH